MNFRFLGCKKTNNSNVAKQGREEGVIPPWPVFPKDAGAKGRIEGKRPRPRGKPPEPTPLPPNDDFRKMLRKHLPRVLRELSDVGIISIYDGLKQSPRIRMEIRD